MENALKSVFAIYRQRKIINSKGSLMMDITVNLLIHAIVN